MYFLCCNKMMTTKQYKKSSKQFFWERKLKLSNGWKKQTRTKSTKRLNSSVAQQKKEEKCAMQHFFAALHNSRRLQKAFFTLSSPVIYQLERFLFSFEKVNFSKQEQMSATLVQNPSKVGQTDHWKQLFIIMSERWSECE